MGDRASIPSRLRLALAAVLAVWARPVPAFTEPRVVRDPPETLAVADDEVIETIPLAWLDRTITVEQAEAENPGIADERVDRFPEAGRPFGFENARWEALRARMKPGDTLWRFASPAESWRHLAGRAGIALVRGGKVVDAMVTIMN